MARFEEMETFVCIVDAGSFSSAARELGLSLSGVSKQIRALENRLNVRLLHRTTRALSLTDAGRSFVERSRAILQEVDDVERTLRGVESEPIGTLRVTAPQDFARLHLCEMLTEFAAKHSALSLDITITDRIVDIVEEGVDVAIRIAALGDSSLIAKKLAPCRQVLVATPAYLEAHGVPKSPRDLKNHECIAYEYLAEPGWKFRSNARSLVVRTTGRLRTNSGWANRMLVLGGQGIAMLPTFLVGEDLREGRLVEVLKGSLAADLGVYALYPHRKHLSAKVRLLIDFLSDQLSGTPPWDAGLTSVKKRTRKGARALKGVKAK